jgi:hypothetical protein
MQGTAAAPTRASLRSEPAPAVLGPGTRLLHIGPHKTGTTAVQSAFHAARPELARQGVRYAGADRHAVVAVQAAIETPPGPGARRAHPIRPWRRLLGDLRRSGSDRVVVSSEWFSDADPVAIRRILEDLGPGPIHVVVTVRSLLRILPSQWQQYVRGGLTEPYEAWLEAVLDESAPLDSGPPISPTFWRRHRHDRLVTRWAEAVGPENVTVVVLGEPDGSVLRAFEALLGLAPGTLVPEDSRANRSLTMPEAEVLRALNRELRREVPDSNLRLNLGLYGAAAALEASRPEPSEPRIETPAWAAERATEIGHAIVEGLAASGVRVIGDLRWLASGNSVGEHRAGPRRPKSAAPSDDPWATWPRVGATAAVGVLVASGLARADRARAGIGWASAALRPLSSERLRRVLVQRIRCWFRDRVVGWYGLHARARSSGREAPSGDPRPRALSEAEAALLERFREAVAEEGLPSRVYEAVLGDGVLDVLRRREMPVASDEAPSAELAARLAMGVARASGLLPADRPRVPPPRARIETSEVARVATPTLFLVVASRLRRGAVATRSARREVTS